MPVVAGKTTQTRTFEHELDDGNIIKLEVKDCREECPYNHHEFCNYGGKQTKFRMIDIAEMKQHGFPEMCPMPFSN